MNTTSIDPTDYEHSLPYDTVAWHLNENYPEHLDPSHARTHIGIYLAWLAEQNLLATEFVSTNAESTQRCQQRELKGSELLATCCNDRLEREFLSPTGQAFSDYYYNDNYVEDYVETLDDENYPSIFDVPDDWASYIAMRDVLQASFERWQRGEALDHSAPNSANDDTNENL